MTEWAQEQRAKIYRRRAFAMLRVAAEWRSRYHVMLEEARLLDRQLAMQRDNNHRRNLELDALHYVWCDGGCPGGTHRWTEKSITEDIVFAAIRNTERLVRWWINARGKEAPTTVESRRPIWEAWNRRFDGRELLREALDVLDRGRVPDSDWRKRAVEALR